MQDSKPKPASLVISSLLNEVVKAWRDQGWSGVTQTTAELLSYWFEQERDGAYFHPCQQEAIEAVIYCHEILGISNPYQLYTEFNNHLTVRQAAQSKVLQEELNPITFPKYCLKMATGSGKTWVLNALIVWHYFNTINDEKPNLFTNRFLIVTPGREVQKRIISAIEGSDADMNRDLFMPNGVRWRDRFHFEIYKPSDFRENLTITDGAFIAITNWQQFRFSNDDPSLWEEFTGEREDTPKAEIIADLLTEYPNICVLNDEAHHVHATKRPSLKSKKDEELIWRRFMSYLYQRQNERHPEEQNKVFKQIDFSATPFFGSGDKKEFFPHIIYDYDLSKASADMLVKQIFLEQRQGQQLEDLDFRAERANADGRKKGDILDLSRGQKIMLEIGRSKLEQLTTEFQEFGINRKPVMLVLAEETEVADLVAEHFNTLADGDGNEYNSDRVVVYHSNLKDAEYNAASDKLDEIDDNAKPLQVVVSVLSVREGFDRTNICVIVMLRASEADLLLEQIVGRGLRLMFPPYIPEYDQIQELKTEARQQLLDREAPNNAFDCLFLVEHPKFKDFYENYLIQQGHAIGIGDSSGKKSTGDLVAVDVDASRVDKYDICFPMQIFDQTPIPNLAEIDVRDLAPYEVFSFDWLKKVPPKTIITDVHLETETRAKTWELEQDYFDYNYFLQRIARNVTQSSKMSHLTALISEIAALVDEYVGTVMFKQNIDFTDPDNYKVLQSQRVIDAVTNVVRVAIQEATGNLQYQPGAVWRSLSDIARLFMRQSNIVQVYRCIYPYQGVQSIKGGFERRVINKLLNPSPEVLAFAKLDRKHDLTIAWRDERGIQRKYEPDFVVKTSDTIFLFETKGDHLIGDPSTALKAQAAVAWCKSASTVKPPRDQPQQWEYVILKQSVFEANDGASFSSLLPIMQMERDALIAGLYGELNLKL